MRGGAGLLRWCNCSSLSLAMVGFDLIPIIIVEYGLSVEVVNGTGQDGDEDESEQPDEGLDDQGEAGFLTVSGALFPFPFPPPLPSCLADFSLVFVVEGDKSEDRHQDFGGFHLAETFFFFGGMSQKVLLQVGQMLGIPGLRGNHFLPHRLHCCSLITSIS